MANQSEVLVQALLAVAEAGVWAKLAVAELEAAATASSGAGTPAARALYAAELLAEARATLVRAEERARAVGRATGFWAAVFGKDAAAAKAAVSAVRSAVADGGEV